MNKAEWSGWVQAVGSIGAIAAGAVTVWWQAKKDRRTRRETQQDEDARFLRIIGVFVFEVRAKLRFIEEEELPHLQRNWTSIEGPVGRIEAIPFDRYPVERVAFAVSSALLSYNFMRDAYRTRGLDGHIERSRQHTLAQFFRAERTIEDALVARNSKLERMEISLEGLSIRVLEPDPVPATYS